MSCAISSPSGFFREGRREFLSPSGPHTQRGEGRGIGQKIRKKQRIPKAEFEGINFAKYGLPAFVATSSGTRNGSFRQGQSTPGQKFSATEGGSGSCAPRRRAVMSGDILCGHSWEEEYGPGKPLKSCSAQGGSLAIFRSQMPMVPRLRNPIPEQLS